MPLLFLAVLAIAAFIVLVLIPGSTPRIDLRLHPSGLAVLEQVRVNGKQMVWFERSSHMPNTEEKDKFNQFMIDTVLPALPECASRTSARLDGGNTLVSDSA